MECRAILQPNALNLWHYAWKEAQGKPDSGEPPNRT